jgi:hypothetical protein
LSRVMLEHWHPSSSSTLVPTVTSFTQHGQGPTPPQSFWELVWFGFGTKPLQCHPREPQWPQKHMSAVGALELSSVQPALLCMVCLGCAFQMLRGSRVGLLPTPCPRPMARHQELVLVDEDGVSLVVTPLCRLGHGQGPCGFSTGKTHLLPLGAITAWTALSSRVSPAPLQGTGMLVGEELPKASQTRSGPAGGPCWPRGT